MPAVVARAMAVEGVAAKSAYAAAKERTGQRIAFKGGGEASTGHSADGSGGEHAMFTRAAGRKAEAEQADEAEGDEAAHRALLCGLVWPGGSPFGELALCWRNGFRFFRAEGPGEGPTTGAGEEELPEG